MSLTNHLRVRGLLPMLPLAAMALLSSPQAFATPPDTAHGVAMPPSSGLVPISGNHEAGSRSAHILAVARSVYGDLQEARLAALARAAATLRLDLQAARKDIRQLPLPTAVAGLQAQLRVIRNNLRDREGKLDPGLWIPISSEIDQLLVYVPEREKRRIRDAIKEAKEAAVNNDRKTMATLLKTIASSISYAIGAFPLYRVEEDIESAWVSANASPPYWDGALEAIESALGSLHWYTHAPTKGLLDAQDELVSAYILVTDLRFRTEQGQQALHYLLRAQSVLQKSPGGKELANEVQGLIDRLDLSGTDIKRILGEVQEQIESQRRQSESVYRKNPGVHSTSLPE